MAEIRHFGVFMQLLAHTVAHELANHRETVFFHIRLHGVADVAHSCACLCRFHAKVKRLVGHIHQPLGFHVNLAARKGAGIVAIKAVQLCAGVDAYNITRPDHDVLAGQPVDHRVVQTDAGCSGEPVQALKVGLGSVPKDKVVNNFVKLSGCHAGLDMLAAILQRGCADRIDFAHFLQFHCIFDLDHRFMPPAPS